MAAALTFVLSCLGLIIFVWVEYGGAIPFAPRPYRVRAVFTETGLLVPGADVRISGVNVGRVGSVTPRGVRSAVVLDIEPRYAPVPADTRAILRTKTLLGEAYVDLSPGNRTGPTLPDGGTLPPAQIAPTQQLDQVLNAFTTPVQHHLETLLTDAGRALAGQGQNLNDALGDLDPATAELSAMAGVLHSQQGELGRLIRDSAQVLSTVAARRDALRTLLGAGNAVLSATAREDAAVRATVRGLSPFVGELHTTLTDLNATLGIARPALASLAPAAPLLAPALHGLSALAVPVRRLLAGAPSVLHEAEVAFPAVARFARAFRPQLDALLPVATQVVPVITYIGENRQAIVDAMVNGAAILQGTTAAQTPTHSAHYIRALSTFGSDSAFGETVRSPGQRQNPYLAPGALSWIGRGGMRAETCDNVHDRAQLALGVANVPCRLQPSFPWGHGFGTRYYPHVRAQRP